MKKKLSLLILCSLCMTLLTACDGMKVFQNYVSNLGISFGRHETADNTTYPVEEWNTEPEIDVTEPDTENTEPEQTTVVEVRKTAEEIPYNDPITNTINYYEADKKNADKKNPEVGKLYYLGNLRSEKVQFDLDCNGKTNTISVEFNDYDGIDSVKVSKSEMEFHLDYIEPVAYAISLDGKTYCLALFDYGMSDDYASYFFRFDGENLIYVGSMPFFESGIEVRNNDPKTLKIWGSRRFDLIQTEFCMTAYSPVIGRDGFVSSLEQVEQKYYNYSYAINEEDFGYYYRNYPLRITQDLQVYSKPDYYSEKYILEPGAAQFTYTDAEEWIFVECEDGSNGWLSSTEFISLYGYSMSVIEGLNFAD